MWTHILVNDSKGIARHPPQLFHLTDTHRAASQGQRNSATNKAHPKTKLLPTQPKTSTCEGQAAKPCKTSTFDFTVFTPKTKLSPATKESGRGTDESEGIYALMGCNTSLLHNQSCGSDNWTATHVLVDAYVDPELWQKVKGDLRAPVTWINTHCSVLVCLVGGCELWKNVVWHVDSLFSKGFWCWC